MHLHCSILRPAPTNTIRKKLSLRKNVQCASHTYKKKRGAATELCKFPEEQWKQITIISLIYSSLPSDVHSKSIDKIKMQSLLQRVQHRFFLSVMYARVFTYVRCAHQNRRALMALSFIISHISHAWSLVFQSPTIYRLCDGWNFLRIAPSGWIWKVW